MKRTKGEDLEQHRLEQVLGLVAKEDYHLQAVSKRLFKTEEISEEWLQALLETPEGIDRLESFGAKFGRMQDTVMDKLIPQLLRAAGEIPGTAIDNLNRAERLNLISEANDWIIMRRVRNQLVHEYIDSITEMVLPLRQARQFTEDLHKAYKEIKKYAEDMLGVTIPDYE